MGSVLVALCVGVAAFALLNILGERLLLFPSPAPPKDDVASRIPGLQKLSLEGARGVDVWLLSAREVDPPYPLVIFAHGNAELIDHWAALVAPLREAGFGVLLVEYPGYGRSAGSPSQTSITETFVAAYDAVVERPEIRRDAIVGYGRSLGGAVICQLAARRPLRGLVLESTFRGVRAMARPLGIPGWLIRDPFDSEAVLVDYPSPVLFLHGRRDHIVPVSQAEALDRVTPDSELRTFPCGHNDCPRQWPRILTFLSERLGLPDASP